MTDGDRIKALLAGRNQAAFARDHGIPGGASMVSQHMSGHRPVAIEAAIAYARGFGVRLEEVSPAAAAKVSEAAALVGATPPASTAPSVDEALVRIGVELARDLPEFVRDDLADEMAKWVRRKGVEHNRQRVAQLLETSGDAQPEPGKRLAGR